MDGDVVYMIRGDGLIKETLAAQVINDIYDNIGEPLWFAITLERAEEISSYVMNL